MKIVRPVTRLSGSNRGMVRQRLGNIHCMTSIKQQLRHARPQDMRRATWELRRGWVLCVLETIREYRGTFYACTSCADVPPLSRKDSVS
jgi:hypothetical protein